MIDYDIPSTMPEQVEEMVELDINYRNLHDIMTIKNEFKDKEIQVPFASLTHKYRDYLSSIIETVRLSKQDQNVYKYKPKALSEYLYGTTEFWSDILVLNKCYSVVMFKPGDSVKIYDPEQFKTLLNEIIILEENLKG